MVAVAAPEMGQNHAVTHPVAVPARLITIAYFVGVYTSFSIYGSSGSLIVPYAVANAAGLMGGLLYWPQMTRRPQVAGWVFLFLCVFVVSAMISAWSYADSGPRLLATAQITMSLVCGVGAMCAMLGAGRTALAKIVRWLATAILVASVVELIAPRDLVRATYELLYSWRPTGFYTEVLRDENLWGWARPLGLSTEPSFAGIFVGFFALLDDILTRGTKRQRSLAATLLFLLTAFAVIRSATVFYFVVLIVVRRVPSNEQRVLFGAGVLVVGAVALFLQTLTPTSSAFFEGGSFFARVIAPYAVAADVAVAHPFLGLGIGSEAEALPYVSDVWSRYGAWSSYDYFYGKSASLLITSNVAWIFIYLGAVGGLVFLYIMYRLLALIVGEAHAVWTLAATILIWTTIGGFVDARTWAIYFSLAGATRLARVAAAATPLKQLQ